MKIVLKGKRDNSNTHIHDRSLSWHATDTSIKRGGVVLVLWANTNNHYFIFPSCLMMS